MYYPDPESAVLEFKREFPKKDQIIKTIVGFCNRHGGTLVIGVEDTGKVVGIDPDRVEEHLEYLDKMIYESTSPPIIPLIYPRRLGEQTVLVIEVSSGMSKPYYKSVDTLL